LSRLSIVPPFDCIVAPDRGKAVRSCSQPPIPRYNAAHAIQPNR